MRLFPLLFALLLAPALLLVACRGGDDAQPAPAPAPAAQPAPLDSPSFDSDVLLADLSALTRSFFGALARGDGPAVYDLLASETQAQVPQDDVIATAQAVAQATPNPGFVLHGLTILSASPDRAEFLIDGYLTRNGERVGTAEQAQNADPLVAVRQDGRWRLLLDPAFFRVGTAQVEIER